MTARCPVRVAAARWPGGEALVFEGQRWTWAQLDALVEAWAATVSGQGLVAGDRLAVVSWNSPALLALCFAAPRVGVVLVPFNTRLTPAELKGCWAQLPGARCFAQSPWLAQLPGAEAFPNVATDASTSGLSREDFAGAAAAAGDVVSTRSAPDARGASSSSVDAAKASPGAPDPKADADVVAELFTSGTTGGDPRRVPITRSQLAASAAASGANLGASESDRWLGVLPLFHIGGLAMAWRCAVDGAALVLEPRFDAGRAASLLVTERISHASLVPAALDVVIDALDRRPPASLRAVLVGGGPASAVGLARAREAGVPALLTYGLTEACSQVTTERPGAADGSTAGHALDGVEVRIVDSLGVVAPGGVVGTIEVRGPTVAAPVGVWLDTGDLGSLDAHGRLTLFSRRVDRIVSGGENVSPLEVEDVLLRYPGVAEAAVVPRADARWGQVPVAVLSGNASISAQALEAHCRAHLAGFKVPRAFLWLEALPRNALGKVLRRQLVSLVDAPAQ